MIIQMGDVYALSPFGPITIVKSVQGGGGFSSGHRWGILGGRQGMELENQDYFKCIYTQLDGKLSTIIEDIAK